MTIILARLTSEHASAARVVHIFDPQFDQDRDGARKAHCGFEVHHDRLEIVDAFTGMPCDLCLLAAPAGAETNSLPERYPIKRARTSQAATCQTDPRMRVLFAESRSGTTSPGPTPRRAPAATRTARPF